jgi:hypothetical protein
MEAGLLRRAAAGFDTDMARIRVAIRGVDPSCLAVAARMGGIVREMGGVAQRLGDY